MIKPNDYDTAERFRDFPKLPAGGWSISLKDITRAFISGSSGRIPDRKRNGHAIFTVM